MQIRNDFGDFNFGGPCPPIGDKPHHYIITVYALKTEKLDVKENFTAAHAAFMINHNVIAKAQLTGLYGRYNICNFLTPRFNPYDMDAHQLWFGHDKAVQLKLSAPSNAGKSLAPEKFLTKLFVKPLHKAHLTLQLRRLNQNHH